MKNLLNNAVNELVIRVNEEYDNARKEIKVLEDKGLKLNALYERRHNLKNRKKADIFIDKLINGEATDDEIMNLPLGNSCYTACTIRD